MNNRLKPKERGLLKGAIRRVFSRSDLRKEAIEAVAVSHSDPSRPRVKKWGICPLCTNHTPLYLFQVDHLDPIIPTNSSLEEMTWDDVVNRTWCDANNLQAICPTCHIAKTKAERAVRVANKRIKKKG